MNKYLKVGLILALVTSICGLLIALLNQVTAPIIEKNAYEKEQNTLQEIYSDATFTVLDLEFEDANIEKVYKATKNEEVVGYVYVVSGKNAYGKVQLMLGINNDVVNNVVITENTESFGKLVNSFVEERINSTTINSETINDVDVKCGATYGAKLVQSLINSALKHYQGGIK